MGGMNSKWVNGNLVYHDSKYKWRWLDAIGPSVVKFVDHFVHVPTGLDNADPAGWVLTNIAGDAGDVSITAGTTHSGEMILTTDDTENDGLNLQLAGEAFILAENKPCYFGVKLKVSDADATDLIVGLSVTDAGIWASEPADFCIFQSADATAVCTFTTRKDSSETNDTSSGTLGDNTYSVLEFMWDGLTKIDAYFDNVLVATSITNLPNDEAMTPTIELLTGETGVNTVTIDWLRVIQCR